jgi:hypothetical protein
MPAWLCWDVAAQTNRTKLTDAPGFVESAGPIRRAYWTDVWRSGADEWCRYHVKRAVIEGRYGRWVPEMPHRGPLVSGHGAVAIIGATCEASVVREVNDVDVSVVRRRDVPRRSQ